MPNYIGIDIILNGAKFAKKNIESIKSTLTDTKKESDSLGASFISIGKTLGIGGVLFAGFTTIKNAIGDATTEYIEFDKRIREINTILPNGQKVTKDLVTELKNLSDQFATSTVEQARAFYQVISSGTTDAEEATKLLTAANKLALGGLSDIGSSIDILTDVVNVYGRENITAADAADTLFQAVKLGKTTVGELGDSIGSIIPTANALGVSFDDVAGTLAALTTKGQSTSERVTQLNAVFTAVLKKGSEAKKFGDRVGDAFNITALRTKGLSRFLKDLVDAADGSEETLTKLFGRVEGAKAVIALANDNFVTLNKTLDEFKNKTGAANESVKEIQKSLDFRIDRSIRGFKNFGTLVADALKPAANAVLGVTESILESVGLLAESNENKIANLKDEIKRLTKSYNELSFNAKTGFFGKSLTKSIDEAKKKLEELTSEAKKAKNELKTKTDESKQILIDKANLENEIAEAKKGFEKLDTLLKDAGKSQKEIIQETYNERLKIIKRAFDTGKIDEEKIFDLRKRATSDYVKEITAIELKEIEKREKEKRKLEKKLEDEKRKREEFSQLAADSPITALLSGEAKTKTQKSEVGLGLTNSILKGAEGARKLLVDGSKQLVNAIAPGLGDAAGPILEAFTKGPDSVKAFVQDFARSLPEIASNLILSAPAFIEALIEETPQLIESILEAIPKVVTTLVTESIGKLVGKFIENVPQIVASIAKGVFTALSDGASYLIDQLRDFPRLIGNAAIRAGNFLIDSIKNAFKSITGGASDFISDVGDFLGFAKGGKIPKGFNNDNFPMTATSGEYVIDRSLTSKLESFLANSSGRNDSNASLTNSLLTSILGQLQNQQNISTSVNFDNDTLAEILINLNRTGTRIA